MAAAYKLISCVPSTVATVGLFAALAQEPLLLHSILVANCNICLQLDVVVPEVIFI